ncbi:hypothetical protein EMIHUDRAFT_237316 [Emiliania huxleyi CCMP1516]|uniref:Glutaredoxin-like protein n=2 Tax=Emiliania huxleyi TaxID=2903 RepID=A0A0D3JQY2_EMIH1|nr:hypothetical protein EMIHUDRAFT_237316 [Emiliania huxleyi CCMP1516]EOD25917.1 hypothetical protein EMIHUDRAFT_237316 [Emiliania huxleyi CCMP1516]|eukprot:XP_005778346.1 hypothetical protein EMIHUDRAFT_237316 [Emiliania huxleyi CCMP1516]
MPSGLLYTATISVFAATRLASRPLLAGPALRQSRGCRLMASADVPAVRLFTKEGCTLCDKVRDVLRGVTDRAPHSLEAVDITDEDHAQWLAKYKYDIPVLHLDGAYWTKHRLTEEEACRRFLMWRRGAAHPLWRLEGGRAAAGSTGVHICMHMIMIHVVHMRGVWYES